MSEFALLCHTVCFLVKPIGKLTIPTQEKYTSNS